MHLPSQSLTKTILAVGALLLLMRPASAQTPRPAPPRPGVPAAPGTPGGRQGQRGGRGLSLAMLPVNVLDMLTSLKADQKSKISEIEDKTKADLKTADRATRGAILTKANEAVKALLTPAQATEVQKALPTLGLVSQSRAIPMGALGDVKLTRSQMSKISGLTAATATQLKGLRGQERQAKMQQVGPALKTQIEGVLTASQKSVIAKYEAAHPRGQRGGFGGSGQRNGREGTPAQGAGAPPGSRPPGGRPSG